MKIPFFRPCRASNHQVLDTLSDGKFHSGLDLAEDLNLSRTAIWKIIQKIQKDSLDIETHRRKGYRLKSAAAQPLSFLSEEKIVQALPETLRDICEIFIYQHCSCEHWAEAFFKHRRPLTEISLCLLETQGSSKLVSESAAKGHLHMALGLSNFFDWDLKKFDAKMNDFSPDMSIQWRFSQARGLFLMQMHVQYTKKTDRNTLIAALMTHLLI